MEMFEDSVSKIYQNTVLKSIIKRAWFERMWTIQEVAMSKHSVLICGQRQLTWADFEAIFIELGTRGDISVTGSGIYGFIDMHIYFRQLYECATSPWQSRYTEHRFLLSLSYLRHKQASKPEDKVFALYNLFQAIGITLPNPDYDKAPAKIFAETAAAIISARRSLMLLYLVTGRQVMAELPSWAPNWNSDLPAVPLIVNNLLETEYRVSRQSPVVFGFSGSGSHLNLKGMVIDTIIQNIETIPDTLEKSFTSIGDGMSSVRIMREWLQAAASWSARGITRSRDVLGDLFHTIFDIGPSTYLHGLSARAKSKDPLEVLEGLKRHDFPLWARLISGQAGCCTHISSPEFRAQAAAKMKSDLVGGPLRCDDLDQHEDSLEFATMLHLEAHNIECFHSVVAAGASTGNLILTKSGYIGKAPVSVELGDVAALISGMELVMFLRPAHDGYRLIGPGYLHGLMYGEKWLEDENGLENIKIL